MRMNSPTGKMILSVVRNGDYAHPGEEDSIRLAMEDFPLDRRRKILDVGCGRGGTAYYIQSQGWGRVTGFDIDEVSIEYANLTYPTIEFVACSVYDSSAFIRKKFHLLCLFNSFYAFDDQVRALAELRKLVRVDGILLISDYLDLSNGKHPLPVQEESGTCFNPLKSYDSEKIFKQTGWIITNRRDISDRYHAWYETLISRIKMNEHEIVNIAGSSWFDFVRGFYSGMLDSIIRGHLGGVIITAVPDLSQSS